MFVALLSRSNFTCDVELFSLDVEFLEDLGDFNLISVDAGSINMPVSNVKGILKSMETIFSFEFIGSVTENRNSISSFQLEGRM